MTDDKDNAVLEPCPFCRKQCATLVIDQGDKWAHYGPSCLEVRTGYNLSEDAPWRDEAIAAWNTRQPTQSGSVPQFAFSEWWNSRSDAERSWLNREPQQTREYVFRAGFAAALQEQSK